MVSALLVSRQYYLKGSINMDIRDVIIGMYNELLTTYKNKQNRINKILWIMACVGAAYAITESIKRKEQDTKIEKLNNKIEELSSAKEN